MNCESKLSKQDQQAFKASFEAFRKVEAKGQVQAGGIFLDAGNVVPVRKVSKK
jgi:hypothetical protein